jgi:hypothetical protein
MRSLRFCRVRDTASFIRSKRPGVFSVLPKSVWIMEAAARSEQFIIAMR